MEKQDAQETHPEISVVVPVYNSEDCIQELIIRVGGALEPLSLSYEIVLVNDSSNDNSWEVIKKAALRNTHVVGICLRRNFGQDSALMAGLRAAMGNYVVIMDDDLQHDPVFIPMLYNEIRKGCDVVYGKYRHKKQKPWKNLGSAFNDRVANIVLKKPREIYLSPYKIIARQTVLAVCEYDGPFPYIDGLLFRVTRHVSQIDIRHQDRFAGRSNYTVVKSFLVWANLITSFSMVPLRLATILGLVSSATGILFGIYILIAKLIFPSPVQGWTSLFVSIFLLGGVQLFSIGMVGEYLGRLYQNVSKQPQYVVSEMVGR
ncbi:MAG: glycosyltransferase family 2 protein [Verrucomicrobia bacterium]|nr:glycosyltransferase family 2 protein [Verrucomicrobiota bacterium]MBU1909825.1 glycosyltransferase family 2 protein [Verrucomicrobiota bacterium]